MATPKNETKPQQFRLNDETRKQLAELSEKLGGQNLSNVVRLAIYQMWRREVEQDGKKKKN